MKIIAHLHSGFPEKFGIPRQSGLVEELKGQVVFLPDYRRPEAVRGLEGFTHIWLIWQFSEADPDGWSPTVRPPRLGGNQRMGVFATRSPNRPNPIGLSCVRLEKVEPDTPEGPVLHVLGADLMDGTPILDIKPYLPYTDCRTDARGGFADQRPGGSLEVEFSPSLPDLLSPQEREVLKDLLSQDPRPAYHHDPQREYGLSYAGLDVKFRVDGSRLTVCGIERKDSADHQGMP